MLAQIGVLAHGVGEKSQSLHSIVWRETFKRKNKPIKSMGPLQWGDGFAIMSDCGKSLLVLGKTGYAEEKVLLPAEM